MMLKLARRARGHFVMLIEIRVHLIRVKPGHISILFNISVNDFYVCVTKTQINTYADDNQLHFRHECPLLRLLLTMTLKILHSGFLIIRLRLIYISSKVLA